MSLKTTRTSLTLEGKVLVAQIPADTNKTVRSTFDLSTKLRVHGYRLRWGGDSGVHPVSYGELVKTTVGAFVQKDIHANLDLENYLCVEDQKLRSLTEQERLFKTLKALYDDGRITIKAVISRTASWYADLGIEVGCICVYTTESSAERKTFSAAFKAYGLDASLVEEEDMTIIKSKSTLEALFLLEDMLMPSCTVKGGETKQVQSGKVQHKHAVIAQQWPVGKPLTYGFIGGTQQQRAKVDKTIVEWTYYANISFKFLEIVPGGQSPDIRISFDPRLGSWSTVGTGAKQVGHQQATMNLGWITKREECRIDERGTILHEFGHALGLMHEHQSPARGITFDEGKVYEYYEANQGWGREQIKEQIIDKYKLSDVSNFTRFDPTSIMMYAMPGFVTKENKTVKTNNVLSDLDKASMVLNYPYDKPCPEAREWTFEHALDIAGFGEKDKQELTKAKEVRDYDGLRLALRTATHDKLASGPDSDKPSVKVDADIEKAIATAFARAFARLDTASEIPTVYTLPASVQHGLIGSLLSGFKNIVMHPDVLGIVQNIGLKVVESVMSKAKDLLTPDIQHSLQQAINSELADLGNHPAVHTMLHGLASGAVDVADSFPAVPVDHVEYGLVKDGDPRIQHTLKALIDTLPKLAAPATDSPLGPQGRYYATNKPAEVAVRNLLSLPGVQNAFGEIARSAFAQVSGVAQDDKNLEPRIKAAFSDLANNADIIEALVNIASNSLDTTQPISAGKREQEKLTTSAVLPFHVEHGLFSSMSSVIGKIISNPLFREVLSGVGNIVINKVIGKLSANGQQVPLQAQHALRLSMVDALLDISQDPKVRTIYKQIGSDAADKTIKAHKVQHALPPMHGLWTSVVSSLKTFITSPLLKGILTDLAVSTINKVVANYSASEIPPHVEHNLRMSLDKTLTDLTKDPAVVEAIEEISSIYIQQVLSPEEAEKHANLPPGAQNFLGTALTIASTVGGLIFEIPAVRGAVGRAADFVSKKIFGSFSHGLAPEIQHAIQMQLADELHNAVSNSLPKAVASSA